MNAIHQKRHTREEIDIYTRRILLLLSISPILFRFESILQRVNNFNESLLQLIEKGASGGGRGWREGRSIDSQRWRTVKHRDCFDVMQTRATVPPSFPRNWMKSYGQNYICYYITYNKIIKIINVKVRHFGYWATIKWPKCIKTYFDRKANRRLAN